MASDSLDQMMHHTDQLMHMCLHIGLRICISNRLPPKQDDPLMLY